VALREAPLQAVEHKPPTTFTEILQEEPQSENPMAEERAEQPRPHKEPAEAARRVLQAARAARRPGRPAWPAQRQPEALQKPSKAKARRIRNNHIQESIRKKKTN
jgi:hypothetical protein